MNHLMFQLIILYLSRENQTLFGDHSGIYLPTVYSFISLEYVQIYTEEEHLACCLISWTCKQTERQQTDRQINRQTELDNRINWWIYLFISHLLFERERELFPLESCFRWSLSFTLSDQISDTGLLTLSHVKRHSQESFMCVMGIACISWISIVQAIHQHQRVSCNYTYLYTYSTPKVYTGASTDVYLRRYWGIPLYV